MIENRANARAHT